MRRLTALLAVLGVLAVFGSGAPADAAGSIVPIDGYGSSWAGPAIEQWSIAAATAHGIQITFTPNGSAAGWQNYIANQADFAASDIAFLTTPDPFNGGTESVGEAYSYVPIVAGGTSFMYNLVENGKQITNLRLSGLTIAKIFTGQITNWDDPAIAQDYGAQLPNQPITVVTRSDGSGASYMFTRWLSKQFSTLWNGFCKAHGGPSPCPPTEFYPGFAGSVQKNGSDQVASFLSSSISEGAIGYDEYSYAKFYGIPAVKMLNAAGYYSLPTPSNVAIALQAAVIDENANDVDFLMQNLDKVYTYGDKRTYPLSSYSYLVIPRNPSAGRVTPTTWNTSKGATVSTWLNYVLCGAQKSAGNLGYSPLPKNLVVGGFQQVDAMPGHVATPDQTQLNGCDNPTYSNGVNHLIVDAPMPSPCDYYTAPLNCTVNSRGQAVNQTGNSTGTGGGTGTGTGTGNGTGNGAANPGASAGPNANNPSAAASGAIDPNTGQVLGASNAQGSNQPVYAESVSVAGRPSQQVLLATLTALELLAAIAAPAVVGVWLQRRRKRDDR
jgi:ABC-type phosphate transport system substrate-binding protein